MYIKNYKTIEPTKIFALDVFEHIPEEELKKIIASFKKLNNHFQLIVSIPTENWLSRKVRKLVGKKEVPDEHVIPYHINLALLKKNFILKKKINFFTVSHLFLFEQ